MGDELIVIDNKLSLKDKLNYIDNVIKQEVFNGFYESRKRILIGMWEKGKVVHNDKSVAPFTPLKGATNWLEMSRNTGRKREDLKKWNDIYEKYPDINDYIIIAEEKAFKWTSRVFIEEEENNIPEVKYIGEVSESIDIIINDIKDELPKIKDNSIDLIIVDPPYNNITNEEWDNQWDTMKDYLDWCEGWIDECKRMLSESGSIYVWGQVGELSDSILRIKLLMDDSGFYFKDWITWKKRRGMGNRRGWLYTREEILWYVKDNNKFFWNEDNQYSEEENQFTEGFTGYDCKSEFKRITNVWTDIPEILKDKNIKHYTPKPLQAIERIIKAHTVEGQTVLDFFAGSGTTGEACVNLKRKCILIEKEKEYLNIIKKRCSYE